MLKNNEELRNNFNEQSMNNTNSVLQEEIIDPKRIQRLKKTDYLYRQHDQKNVKSILKMNLFKEDARKKQRQFHQQTHEYLRISSLISQSALDENKFNNFGKDEKRQAFINNKFFNKQNINEVRPLVNIKLESEFSEAHIKEKFTIKENYLRKPYKRQSIQINPHFQLDPNFQFFIFNYQSNKIRDLRTNIAALEDQINTSELKYSLKKIVNYMTFFDYIHIINQPNIQNADDSVYPQYLLDICNADEEEDLKQEKQQVYDDRQITIEDTPTEHRLFSFSDYNLGKYFETLFFSSVKLYEEYKSLREAEFKNLRIYAKDIEISTDIRYIISSEKIYLIEIMKEIQTLMKISKQIRKIQVMRLIHKNLIEKSEQYLRLICGYTKSQISSKFNIQNQYQKIQTFILQSLIYKRQLKNVKKEVIEKFPVLTIWYNIPDVIFGYTKQTIHQTYYELVKATHKLGQCILRQEKYESLKIKRPQLQY